MLSHSISVLSIADTETVPALQRINLTTVEHCKEKVAADLKRNSYVRVGIVASMIVGGGVGIYALFGDGKAPSPLVPITAEEISRAETESMIKHIYSCMKDQGCSANSSWLKRWGNRLGGQFVLALLGAIANVTLQPFIKYFKVFNTCVDNVVGSVFHDADFTWFTTQRSTLWPLIDDIEYQAAAIKEQINKASADSGVRTKKDYTYYRITTSNTWALCVHQLESILGFMQLKSESFSAVSRLHADHAKAIANKILILADNCSIDIAYALMKEPHTVYDIFHEFRVSLEHEFNRFVQCEQVLIFS